MEDKIYERDVKFKDSACKNIIFANDASIIAGIELQGIGLFPDSISGVRIPTLQRYVEALILLALRCGPDAFLTCSWILEPVHVVQLVKLDRMGHLAFRQYCDQVLRGDAVFRTMIQQAQEALVPNERSDTHRNDVQGIRATWEEHVTTI